MAYDDNQTDPALPAGNPNYRRKTENHLPKYFRTQHNKKFLQATVDQLLQPGVAEKLNGYYGRRYSKAFSSTDSYVGDVAQDRENYQFEPASIIQDTLGNVNFYNDYNDYINQLRTLGNINPDHSVINRQEYYAWNPHINWDKFINFREYYWLPDGPDPLSVFGQSRAVESTFTISLKDNVDNLTYLFTPDGLTSNATITLYRGQTYRFNVNVAGHPIAFATQKSFTPGELVLGTEGEDNSLIYDTNIIKYDVDGNIVTDTYIENGVIEFTVPDTAPDSLYYVSKNDPNVAGFFKIYDILENTEIDVEKEIIGKRTYKTEGGFDLSNGMVVQFVGNVTPVKYATGTWFVEGVGSAIVLKQATSLNASGQYTEDLEIDFDTDEGFDYYPYDEAVGYSTIKDYICINRASQDGNSWSRNNKWFHKSILEKNAEILGKPVDIDESNRAKRPIIEFNAGLKLFNFGTKQKQDVDLVDTFTTDVFSNIEGSQGYNIDGIDITNGMRILFTADADQRVNGKIYQVKFITFNNKLQITLVETADSIPLLNETILVTNGTTNRGKFYYYNGTRWVRSQEKTSVNQAPLFDLFDNTGTSFADSEKYASTSFFGNKIFSYAEGTGTNDTELGFPLSYRNIENSGDIVFIFDLFNSSFNYQETNEIVTVNTDTGYVREYNDREVFETLNGWAKKDNLSEQNVIRQFVFDNTVTDFKIDVYDDNDFINDLWIRVYLNNELKFEGVDYDIVSDANNSQYVKFKKDLIQDDIILIKTRSGKPKNSNGLYEIPANLEKNPLNENLFQFTLGEVSDHLSTIIEETNNFTGKFPGISNLRDLGNVTYLGKKFLKHSGPINLSLYHLIDKSANIVKAIDFSRREYSKFKRQFLETAGNLGFEGAVKIHTDKILDDLVKDKTSSMPFFFSDMIGLGGNIFQSYIIEDPDERFFPLSRVFSMSELSRKAVQVYKNGIQLTHNKDYTFNSDGFVDISATKAQDDIIEIYEYENTNGSYIPPTPTKLGLYPSYYPKLYIDDTVNRQFVEDESGAWKIYSQSEEGKIGWYYPLYTNIQDARAKDTELGGSGQAHTHKFEGLNKTFFMPNSSRNHATKDNELLDEWPVGIPVIQGHDGSKIVAFKDFRDALLYDLELRIFNNIKISYDTNIFDINDYVEGQHRKNGIQKKYLESPMTGDFIEWTRFVNEDYTKHIYFDRNDTFTFNYHKMSYPTGGNLPGWWREVYRQAFDTDRPHTHPWEMLGFYTKPSWWETQYGPAPYTNNNLILWQDLENGYVKEPNKQVVVKKKYVRPGLTSHIPVDSSGNLRSPNDCGFVANFSVSNITDNFVFGDGSPIESTWKRSSDYVFSLIKSIVINQPNRSFGTIFDRQRQTRNNANQIEYNQSENAIKLNQLVFPNTINDSDQVFTSGLVNYIFAYLSSNTTINYTDYKNHVTSIKNQIGFKLAGYSDKDKFRLILDSRTPLNQGNVFVPDENYKLFLNVSAPLKEISYSGVIVEKLSNGYIINGYDTQKPVFTYFKPIAQQNDPIINVGGVSQAFVNFASGKTYAQGTIVKEGDNFYRSTETHVSGSEIDTQKFTLIPELPLVGGQTAKLRKNFEETTSEIKYGEILNSIQDVVDFLLGLGKYQEFQGFEFRVFETSTGVVQDWQTSVKEFLFWTTQSWGAGSLLTLSPMAEKLTFKSANSIVGNVFDSFYGYSVLKADGKSLKSEFLKISKDVDNTFEIYTANTADGIYAIRLPLVQKEHVCLLDNRTVFGDVIYNVTPGYRQERIKVLGYRTDGWNGSLNIPGFIYDNAIATEWESWKDYSIGDLVKYKEFYYSANTSVSGKETFDSNDWIRLDQAPTAGLFTNFDYRINQFADFYDLDSDNFDIEQQRLAQHLIGYQKRQYLENIVNDDVSQYKFYQGMIQEKGTRNALTKMFDALASADKDSLEFYEEWAIKDGQYGASEGFDEVEFKLDENNFRLVPQPILLTNTIRGDETDLIYRIPEYETYLKPSNYDHKPFPTKFVDKGYTKDAGYVNPEDVNHIIGTYEDITSLNISDIAESDYIWIQNYEQSWNVLQHVQSKFTINSITGGEESFSVHLNTSPHGIAVGDILGLFDIVTTDITLEDSTATADITQDALAGFYKVSAIKLNEITFETTAPVEDIENCKGIITTFIECRVSDLHNANIFAEKNMEPMEKIWIDNNDFDKWQVLRSKNRYELQQEVSNSESNLNTRYGTSISVDDRNATMAIGMPNDGDGKVAIYTRAANSLNWALSQIIEADDEIASPGQEFGYSVALSEDAKHLIVGSPSASNVKTKFKGQYEETTDYTQGDIVLNNRSLWEAQTDITGAQTNIEFNSFASVSDILYNLNLTNADSEEIPILLAGNYPFVNQTADHFLVRAPVAQYEGSGVNDELFFKWNSLTNANQTQLELVETLPFSGSIPYITKEYLESNHTIYKKIDYILYINASTNIPPVGSEVNTQGATGTVAYTYNEGATVVIYIEDANGVFPDANSLFIDDGNFAGEYEIIGSNTIADTSSQLGGFWLIKTSTPYAVGDTTFDTARGLIFKDLVTDSTVSSNYYYNILDYESNVVNSLNTQHSYIRTLSFQGNPGPGGTTDPVLSSLWAVRVPKAVSDLPIVGTEVEFYFNRLKKNISKITFGNQVSVVKGEIITQPGTDAQATVFESVNRSTEVLVQFVSGTFNTVSNVVGSISGPLLTGPSVLPIVDQLTTPEEIGLSYNITNKSQTVVDVWDGYISYRNLFFLDDEPFEPQIGQIVRDGNTGATAEVVFYERSLNDVKLFVKNVVGTWSRGDNFANAAEIIMEVFPGGPNPDAFGRPDIYTVERRLGQTIEVSLGYDPGDIGKLLVFDNGSNIPLPDNNEITDVEYWIYKESTVLGIAREANIPASDNFEYTEIFKIPATSQGIASSLTNEGLYYIYDRSTTGFFNINGAYIGQIRDNNAYIGSRVEIRKKDSLYRGYISSPGPRDSSTISTEDSAGRILFIKYGEENDNFYNWEYARNKDFKGEFSAATRYFTGDKVYLDTDIGRIYTATTNINPGSFDPLLWTSTDDLIDYVGYIPNDTGFLVQNDSATDSAEIIQQNNMHDFGSEYDISKNGEVLVVSVKYTDKGNVVAVYRNNNGYYQWSQDIQSPSNTEEFGHKVSISDDGRLIAVSAPYDDTNKNDQGRVYIYKQSNRTFNQIQILTSPSDDIAEKFGWNLDFDGNNLIVVSKNGDSAIETTFDNGNTYFDNKFTEIRTRTVDTGNISVYQLINDTFVYGHSIDYFDDDNNNGVRDKAVYEFGNNIKLKSNHIYVGIPKLSTDTEKLGTILDYRIPDKDSIYEVLRQSKNTVNIDKIKRVLLYNTKNKKLLTYLDYIDPLQGKIAGIAEENLRYKLYYDPASYSNVIGSHSVISENNNFWNSEQVGQLWWDLTNAKFINPYQDNVIFSTNNWNMLAVGNSIDVYEWVESDYLPSEWDEIADTAEGTPIGISGRSKYGDDVYVSTRKFDPISQTFTTKYYFWVKDKKIKPTIESRSLSSDNVARLIANPAAQGYKFISLISNDSFALFNCDNLLENDDVALSVQYWTIDNQNINIHNQYQIMTEGLATSTPNRDIETKWFDSLIGYDQYSRPVPDPTLSEKERYGILNKPRQGWFINRQEALKQFIERANSVLKKNLIVETKNINNILRTDPVPAQSLNLYDTVVDSNSDLDFLGVAKAKQATLRLIITDGVVTDVVVTDPGRGYFVAPSFTTTGTGEGLELDITINNLGVITSARVLNGGQNYSSNSRVIIRKFTVLVNSDETIQGKWALYERNTELSSWERIVSQSFDVPLYWKYINWFAPGYNELTESKFVVDQSYQLQTIQDNIGDTIKINNIGSGGWLLLRKIDNQENVDYTINYETIGRENGTIQFEQSLYDTEKSLTGFDVTSFDIRFFDSIPTEETRIILQSLKNDILTGELSIEYNNLFFASLRYVLSEQNYIDWAFKTSFVKAKHNVGQLRKDITFNNDNLPSYEEYIKEVKPYRAKLREYLSSYERLDNSQSRITDFDLAPTYSSAQSKIIPVSAKVKDNTIIGLQSELETYPNKNWTDNVGFSVVRVEISEKGQGYLQAPVVTLNGGGGTGAKAVAKLGANGSISAIDVISEGSNYLSAPTLTISGTSDNPNFTPARASVIIGKSLPRNIHTIVKFDRISGTQVITELAVSERFNGTGSKYIFDLKWPMDLRTTQISVTLNGTVLLNSEYTYENVLNVDKGYNRHFGKIILTEPPESGSEIVVNYKKSIDLLTAQDRIELAYNPTTGQYGKDLAQLMDGIDYGGVEVKSFDFGQESGWDTAPFGTSDWDTYDLTYEDEIIKLDGSTNVIELSKPLESGVVYNVYKNGVRIDDPDWTDDSTQFTNPNAEMRSVIGDGVTQEVNIGDFGITGVSDDVFTIRKTTSDGSFLPTNINFDTVLTGGSLDYTNARGINAEEINVDGDGFFTSTTSKGPEEVVPGQIFDTLDLKVYERPTSGASNIVTRNYIGNGVLKVFDIGGDLILDTNILVKIDGNLQKQDEDYTIDSANNNLTFTNIPAQGQRINILNMGYSGGSILDIDTFVADGSTVDFLTNVSYSNGVQSLVTLNGKTITSVLRKADNSYDKPGNIIIRFPEPPADGSIINFAIFIGETSLQNYSMVTIDEFESDGSTTSYELTQTPFSDTPSEWYTVVKINNEILNAGYNEIFDVTNTREYRLKLWQIPLGSLVNKQIDVYLNEIKLDFIQEWTFNSAANFDPALAADEQSGSTVVLAEGIGEPGDKLRVFVKGLDDSTVAGGDYRYGYFDNNGDFVSTPGELYISKNYEIGDKITVYQFSNHDSQRIDRQSFDVVERTELVPGLTPGEQVFELDGSTAFVRLNPELSFNVDYAVFLNNVRIDDPAFGTDRPVKNSNALLQTIEGAQQLEFNLDDNNIIVNPGDILKLVPLGEVVIADEGTPAYYELRQLRTGYVNLRYPAVDDQYVWVVVNGQLLTPSVDYIVTPDKNRIKILGGLQENDTVETIHFSNPPVKQKAGWRQFKDILNRNHYKRIDGQKNYLIAKDLHWYDNSIQLVDASGLPAPILNSREPGVVFINKERVEYFEKDGNFLKQLRRGTLGTGINTVVEEGTEIYDQNITTSLPYKDETLTTIFTADGTTKTYELDFTPNSVNEFEVFVAGRRLRKNSISSYVMPNPTAQDSPDGDIILEPEFSISGNELTLLDFPLENQKVIVIRRQGRLWSPLGTKLMESDSNVAKFLGGSVPDLPG